MYEYLRYELVPSALSLMLRTRFVQDGTNYQPLGAGPYTGRQEQIITAMRRSQRNPGGPTAEDDAALDNALINWANDHRAGELERLH